MDPKQTVNQCQACEFFYDMDKLEVENEREGEESLEEEHFSFDWSCGSETSEEDEQPDSASKPSADQPGSKRSRRCSAGENEFFTGEDSPFHQDTSNDQSDDESPAPKPRRGRERGRGTIRGQSSRSRSPLLADGWKTGDEVDTAPPPLSFEPLRTQGVQVEPKVKHSPLSLFQLFFPPAVVKEICHNTNKYAAKSTAHKSYIWQDVDEEEFYKYLGLVLFTSLVKLTSIQDYWRRNDVTSHPFPASIMTRSRFQTLTWNLHLSDVEKDRENDRKKGESEHDKLFRLRPLYDHVRAACKTSYHPRKELAIDERMVVKKEKSGFTQYKPNKWGIKLFVLADCSNGYTVDFAVYVGKASDPSAHGLSYDAVMNLVQPGFLGTGYHVYMDSFYTSPKLFADLAALKFGACGTYRENRRGCPSSRGVIARKSPRGTMRWLRQDSMVFVKWKDTKEVSVCSTIHPANAGDTVRRWVRKRDGVVKVDVPCPTPIMDYNRYMGGVDGSDQVIQYHLVHRRTSRWYRTVFLHLLDIATTNAYIMHLELAAIEDQQSLSRKDFMGELVKQLCGVEKASVPVKRRTSHIPAACAAEFSSSNRATVGRRRCQLCARIGVRNTTPWKCQACDIPLCLMLDRNCFAEWHV